MTALITSEAADRPGLYRMSETAYHADSVEPFSLSRSIAEKLILESPLHARAAHPKLTKQEPTEEKNDRKREIGSAAHALLLQQPTEIAVLDYKTYASGGAKMDRMDAQERGAIPLLTADYEIAKAMTDKARLMLSRQDHPALKALADPDADAVRYNECTAIWQDRCGDLWARARMDRISVTGDRITIIDYKTTELSVEPSAVARAIYNNNYHFQDAFYRRGVRALFPEIDRHEIKLDFLFVMQEQEAPFEITIARVDSAGRLIGEKMVSDAFLLWRKCIAEDWWPGYPGGIVDAACPAYVDTGWAAREIEHPYLQNLGFDPVPMFESKPYQPPKLMGAC